MVKVGWKMSINALKMIWYPMTTYQSEMKSEYCTRLLVLLVR